MTPSKPWGYASSDSLGNVELLRAYHDEVARASQGVLDPQVTISKMAEFWDPDVEYDMSESPRVRHRWGLPGDRV